MKIDLIDDTAVIETTSSIKNGLKKERTILGVRSNVDQEMIKPQQPIMRMLNTAAASNNKITSLPHVCGNARINQENGNVEKFKSQENGNKKAEDVKKQESVNQELVSTRTCCLNGVGILSGNQEKNPSKKIQAWLPRGKVHDHKEEEVQSRTTIAYSRKQMEDLRFVNMEQQNKKWAGIYCQLGPAVKKEYDGLLDCNNHSQLDIKKKVTAHRILGPMAAKGSWNQWYLSAPKQCLK